MTMMYNQLANQLFAVPDTPETFTMTFRLAENYPVDLYYLMDLSNSMKDDKENLATLGNKIGEMIYVY